MPKTSTFIDWTELSIIIHNLEPLKYLKKKKKFE